jgi:hypothetical protein
MSDGVKVVEPDCCFMSQLILTTIATFSLKSDVHAKASSPLAHDISTMFLCPFAALCKSRLLTQNSYCNANHKSSTP